MFNIFYYNGQESMSPRLPELPNYDIKYIRDNHGKCYVPRTGSVGLGWYPINELDAIDRVKPWRALEE